MGLQKKPVAIYTIYPFSGLGLTPRAVREHSRPQGEGGATADAKPELIASTPPPPPAVEAPQTNSSEVNTPSDGQNGEALCASRRLKKMFTFYFRK